MLRLLALIIAGAFLTLVPHDGVSTAATAAPRLLDPLVGISLPSQRAEVGGEQAGTIAEVPVHEGDVVEKGQVLFRLTSELQQLEVERLEQTARSSLVLQQARAALEHAQGLEDRSRELSDKSIVSGSELEDTEHGTRLAQLKVDQAEFDRALAENALAQARVRLEQRTVRSPLNGIVTRRLKQPGETIEELQTAIEVVSLHPLWVEFECPVTDEASYPVGALALVSPAARPDDTRAGTIINVSMLANPSSHTFRVRLAVPNENRSWKAGLKMLVRRPDGETSARPGK